MPLCGASLWLSFGRPPLFSDHTAWPDAASSLALPEATIYRERNAVAGDMQDGRGPLIQEGVPITSNHLRGEQISHVLGTLENTVKGELVGLQLPSME